MESIRDHLRHLFLSEEAAEVSELAIVLGLVVAATVTIIFAVGISVQQLYATTSSAIN